MLFARHDGVGNINRSRFLHPMPMATIGLAAISVAVGAVAGILGHGLFAGFHVTYFVPPTRPGLFIHYVVPGRIDFIVLCTYSLGLAFLSYPVLGRGAILIGFALTIIGGGLIGFVFSDPRESVVAYLLPGLAGGFFAGCLLSFCVFIYSRFAKRPSGRHRLNLRVVFLAILAISILLAGIAIRRQQQLEIFDAIRGTANKEQRQRGLRPSPHWQVSVFPFAIII